MMQWLYEIFPAGSIATSVAILSLVVVIGLTVGAIRVRGVSLGVAAVLFVALLFSWRGLTLNADVVNFLRDFSLILFVYPIGLQVGPSFLASLRADGLRLNALALAVVVLGAVLSLGVVKIGGLPTTSAAGLYTGGFATTPGLAAAEEGLRSRFHGDPVGVQLRQQTTSVYAVAYPFGLLGPILLVVAYRVIFRVDVRKEVDALLAEQTAKRPPLDHLDIEVVNPEVVGHALKDHLRIREQGLILSRLWRGGSVSVPNSGTVIELGDVYRVVAVPTKLKEIAELFGREKPIDPAGVVGDVDRREFIVTEGRLVGRTLRDLNLTNRFGVNVTRVDRAGIDLTPRADLSLRFADNITAVGPKSGLDAACHELGNSIEELNRPRLIPIFLGIFLGVLVGSIPLKLPGLNTGLRIGLAGGPMLVAIVLSHFGRTGRVVWYMPASANLLLRDFGMAIFLACVGLQSGGEFFNLLLHGDGLKMAALATTITILPMLVVAVFARVVWKMNFVTLCGLTAGSLTSSPTMLFANEMTRSTVPAVAYATVYPISMIAPVICTQILVALTV